jgi:hypothetical protein
MNKLLLALVAGSTLCLAADPFVGVWKPNAEKCKTSPGAPEARKTATVTFEVQGKDKYHVVATTPDGKTQFESIFILDGKQHGQDDEGSTITHERVDARHFRQRTVGSKGSVVADWVVSANGYTLTWTRKGSGATSGRPVDDLYVYDKQ